MKYEYKIVRFALTDDKFEKVLANMLTIEGDHGWHVIKLEFFSDCIWIILEKSK